MSLYTKRISVLSVSAPGLFDDEGKPRDSVEVPELSILVPGGGTLHVKVSADKKHVEVVHERKSGVKSETLFSILL